MKNQTDTLCFESSKGIFELDRADMLFFLDETGQETFSDPNFPLFGLGGVGTNVGYYVDTLRPTWNLMKESYFSGADVPFHAADLREPSMVQVAALAHFFENYQALRVASVVTDQTVFSQDIIPIQAAALSLQQRILDVLGRQYEFPKLYLIFENNQRIEGEIQKFFLNFHELDREGATIPVIGSFMPKTAVEPGLEIADTIMHTTGAQVRNRIRNNLKVPDRKDWLSVWQSQPDNLQSYMEITKVR